MSPLGSACSVQVQSLSSTTHLVRVLKVGNTPNCLPPRHVSERLVSTVTRGGEQRLSPESERLRPHEQIRCLTSSFLRRRCRKCGTGGYLLTSTSSRVFASCATDSSALTNQHGLEDQTTPTGSLFKLCLYTCIVLVSKSQISYKVRRHRLSGL